MLYTHIAQLMTHTTNVYIAATYRAIMQLCYAIMPFGILQSVNKS